MFKPSPHGLHCMGELLKQANEDDDKAVRIQLIEGELELGPDVPNSNDRIFKIKDKPVLIVAEDIAQQLEGRVLDVVANKEKGEMEIFLSEAPKN